MKNIDALAELEYSLVNPQRTYASLGNLKSSMGFASAGLTDLMRAYALAVSPTDDYDRVSSLELDELRAEFVTEHFPLSGGAIRPQMLAWLAEAWRVHARDCDFSRDQLDRVFESLELSRKCFDAATAKFAQAEYAGDYAGATKSWVLAHRGATRTMLYWLQQSVRIERVVPDPDGLFAAALADLEAALALRPDYVWCKRLEAFLFTLRGDAASDDFGVAASLLESVKPTAGVAIPGLDRSLAILFCHQADGPSKKRPGNFEARQALSAALSAVQQDPEDFVASYFAAASLDILSRSRDENSGIYARNLGFAIESARTRALNAISQASAALISLEIIEASRSASTGSLEQGQSEKMVQHMEPIFNLLSSFRPDLETRVIFHREWERFKRMPYEAAYAVLRPQIDGLREKNWG